MGVSVLAQASCFQGRTMSGYFAWCAQDVPRCLHPSVWNRIIMGGFCCGSILNSGLLIRRHLRVPRTHGASTYITRIVIMVPVFSLLSYVALFLTPHVLEVD